LLIVALARSVGGLTEAPILGAIRSQPSVVGKEN
jgi:hypothetical protein